MYVFATPWQDAASIAAESAIGSTEAQTIVPGPFEDEPLHLNRGHVGAANRLHQK